MAKPTYPKDRFDDIPDTLQRVGAHRVQNGKRRGWVGFAWAALATGILVTAGVIGLGILTQTVDFTLPGAAARNSANATNTSPSAIPTASAEPSATTPAAVTPQLDGRVLITVLNGTSTPRLANAAGDELVAKGWGGAATGVGTRSDADAKTATATIVYYTTAEAEAAALKIVEDLGVGTVELSSVYPATPITVVLGTDFVAPA